MPYYIGRVVDDVKPLVVRTPEAFREKQGIEARVSHKVSEIDLVGRRVRVEDLKTGKDGWEPFDKLLVATGAIPITPEVPGVEAKGIYELSTLQSGIRVRQAVDQKNPRQVVIVGGGYIGLEMAENLVLRGLEVSIVEKTGQFMNTLDADMAALINPSLQRAGVQVYLNELLQGLDHDARVDLYSLGATFFHLLEGHCPFEAPDATELTKMVVSSRPAFSGSSTIPDDAVRATILRLLDALMRFKTDKGRIRRGKTQFRVGKFP